MFGYTNLKKNINIMIESHAHVTVWTCAKDTEISLTDKKIQIYKVEIELEKI